MIDTQVISLIEDCEIEREGQLFCPKCKSGFPVEQKGTFKPYHPKDLPELPFFFEKWKTKENYWDK